MCSEEIDEISLKKEWDDSLDGIIDQPPGEIKNWLPNIIR